MIKNNEFIISILLFLAGILLTTSGLILHMDNSKINDKSEEKLIDEKIDEILTEEKVNKVTIDLSFIGDSLLASLKGEKYSMNFQDLLDNHDYFFPFKNVSHIFLNDDFTIANGENVFTDKELTPALKNHNPAYWYYSASKFANIYKESSIEVVSLMNNHSYDYGTVGYNDTIKALEDVGVIPGLEEVLILEKENIKIGLICTNLFHEFQANNTIKKIKEIKEVVDYVIVYFHGGVEYEYKPTTKIIEYSHNFVDNGADLVIGCHPHVLQPIEVYKEKTIVYSLGSFIFGGTLNLKNQTIIYKMSLEFDLDNKTIKETQKIIPCHIYSKKEGYEKWIPDIIIDDLEKQKIIDFMNNQRNVPY